MQLTVGDAGRSLEDNLRKKYAEPGFQAGLDAAIQQQVACIEGGGCTTDVARRPRQTAEDVEVKPCAKCQGAGELKELYGYRVMTTPCDNCSGIGCLTYKQGKLVSEENASAAGHTAAGREKPVWAQRSCERIASLKEQIERIRRKQMAYELEIKQLRASAAAASDAIEKHLQENLIVQLERYVQELRGPLAKREESLRRYTNPTVAEDHDHSEEGLPELE